MTLSEKFTYSVYDNDIYQGDFGNYKRYEVGYIREKLRILKMSKKSKAKLFFNFFQVHLKKYSKINITF